MKAYGQWCSLAKALEVVGERWTLLIVRELLIGPRRYSDLLEDVPGISTDVLAARLRDLEANGLVRRGVLPPPASSTKVYELTPLGEGLRTAVGSLSRWGLQLLGPLDDDEAFRPHWLAISLRGLVDQQAAAGVTLDIDFVLDEEIGTVRIRVEDGAVVHVPDPDTEPDVVVRADLGTLAAVGAGAPPPRGRFDVAGSRSAVRQYTALFKR